MQCQMLWIMRPWCCLRCHWLTKVHRLRHLFESRRIALTLASVCVCHQRVPTAASKPTQLHKQSVCLSLLVVPGTCLTDCF